MIQRFLALFASRRPSWFLQCVAACGLLLAALASWSGRQTVAQEFSNEDLEFFEKEVRPVLVESCGQCHGADADPAEGGLSTASRKSLIQGGDTGAAIEPGAPDASLLVQAINYQGPYNMPPDSKLSAANIAVISEWVRRGAPWPEDDDLQQSSGGGFDLWRRKSEHWCWQSVDEPEPPVVSDQNWPLDPLDSFILNRLEQQGLSPAVEADRRTWLRRVCFDLVGLPPTSEQVATFLADRSEEAFEKVADQLLASEHFGERWARHWMDLVRYAETCGHEYDFPLENAWEYRDFLIRAFNDDVPFNQFVREHIAGDLLPEPRRNPTQGFNESILGTGFWFLGEATHSPVDVRGDEARRIDNQIDVMSKTFLGLTVACARCHDHKFDAITTEDYYALSGYLQSSRRQETVVDTDGKLAAARNEACLNLDRVAQAFKHFPERDPRSFSQQDWEAVLSGQPLPEQSAYDGRILLGSPLLDKPEHPLHILSLAAAEDGEPLRVKLREFAEAMDTRQQARAAFEEHSILFENFQHGIPDDWFATGLAFEQCRTMPGFAMAGGLWYSNNSPASSRMGSVFEGAIRSPTFEITHDQILVRVKGDQSNIHLIIDGHVMDVFNSLLFRECNVPISSPDTFTWIRMAGDIRNYHGHRAWLEWIDHGRSQFEIAEVRFANGDCPEPVDPPSTFTQAVLHDAASVDTRDELIGKIAQNLLRSLNGQLELPRLEAEELLSALYAPSTMVQEELLPMRLAFEERSREMPEPLKAMAMTDGSGEDEHLFIRGNPQTPGALVPRRFLTALGDVDDNGEPIAPHYSGSGRLDLADRIASPENPLTSRVIVNRIWKQLLGRGIVASPDNFGVLGERPSHPELLDHLASQFVEEGWSIKKLIRRIVLSRTYRMASSLDPDMEKADPENILLHRANVRRLEGEAVRDTILTVAGDLDPTMFGPSVPLHLTPFMQGRGRPVTSGPLDGNCRRSIYIEVRRNFLSPMMLAFDSPIPFNTIGRRHVSNVPAQALTLMNDPFVIEQAQRWALRIVSEHPGDRERVRAVFRDAFSREPNDAELNAVQEFLIRQRDGYVAIQDNDLRERQVWQDLCHTVFNMKEFIFID